MRKENLVKVSPGVLLTPSRAAAEALYKDLTNGWVITSQNGLIDCIEDHLRAYASSILADLAIAKKHLHESQQGKE